MINCRLIVNYHPLYSRHNLSPDKFKEWNLQTSKGQKVVTPIIKMPGLHYECKIVFKSAMDPAYLNKDYDKALYPEKDYHTLYFGEIVDCYEID